MVTQMVQNLVSFYYMCLVLSYSYPVILFVFSLILFIFIQLLYIQSHTYVLSQLISIQPDLIYIQ